VPLADALLSSRILGGVVVPAEASQYSRLAPATAGGEAGAGNRQVSPLPPLGVRGRTAINTESSEQVFTQPPHLPTDLPPCWEMTGGNEALDRSRVYSKSVCEFLFRQDGRNALGCVCRLLSHSLRIGATQVNVPWDYMGPPGTS